MAVSTISSFSPAIIDASNVTSLKGLCQLFQNRTSFGIITQEIGLRGTGSLKTILGTPNLADNNNYLRLVVVPLVFGGSYIMLAAFVTDEYGQATPSSTGGFARKYIYTYGPANADNGQVFQSAWEYFPPAT